MCQQVTNTVNIGKRNFTIVKQEDRFRKIRNKFSFASPPFSFSKRMIVILILERSDVIQDKLEGLIKNGICSI